MTMQALNGTASFFQHKYNRDFTIFDAAPYTVAECKAALHTHREEVFRYELHRFTTGVGWAFHSDITQLIKSCTITYDGHGEHFMYSAKFELIDGANVINFIKDKIRVFHMLKMPDGHYVVWEKGTFHVPSPKHQLTFDAVQSVDTQDTLRVYFEDKITDWLKIPSDIPSNPGADDGDPVEWVRHLLAFGHPGTGIDVSPNTTLRVGDAPPPAPILNRSKIYQVGTSILDVVNSLLLFCNYDILHADVDGSLISHPFVKPSMRPVDYNYVADGTSIIVEESGETEQDLWNAPNQWLRVVTRPDAPLLRSRLTLTDPDNPMSTVARDRTVTDYESIDAPTQAVLDTVVQALFEDGQRILKKLKIQVPLMPHDHHDKIFVQYTTNHPWATKANGFYTVYGWEFPCVSGGLMTLNCELVAFSPAVPPGVALADGGTGIYGGFEGRPIHATISALGSGSEQMTVLGAVPMANTGVGTESIVVTGAPNFTDSGAGTEDMVKTP